MLKNFFFLTALLFFSTIISAQTANPKIGTEKGVKEKLIRIKNGLPNIKKNLIKQDDWGDYHVKFEMGNGTILFDEDEEDHEQSLLIRYTPSYFSGTKTDYQNYYKTLLALLKEVFGTGYETRTDDSQSGWKTFFYEKEKSISTSDINITISCSWVLDLFDISITIRSKVK